MSINDELLLDRAKAVRDRAYAPYSGFLVGAAVLDNNGQVHVGSNVESAAYPQGSCAEQNAIGAMVAAGGTSIRRIVVVGGREDLVACPPCGGCRQRISEFADAAMRIVSLDDNGEMIEHTIDELLPLSFSL